MVERYADRPGHRGAIEIGYDQVEGSGPDHDRTFTASATVGPFVGSGTGSSKKVAEHGAAEAVFEMITGAFGSDA